MREPQAREPIRPEVMFPALLARLSQREREVFVRLLEAKTSKEIALELHITKRTVEAHIEHVRGKLLARSIADVIRISAAAERLGLFSYTDMLSENTSAPDAGNATQTTTAPY